MSRISANEGVALVIQGLTIRRFKENVTACRTLGDCAVHNEVNIAMLWHHVIAELENKYG
jgi:hypothetical protein